MSTKKRKEAILDLKNLKTMEKFTNKHIYLGYKMISDDLVYMQRGQE